MTKLNATGTALVYSTYLGLSLNGYDEGLSIAVDAAGNAYVTGWATVAKLNSTGSALLYSIDLGGTSSVDPIRAIAVDSAGNAYVTGQTSSPDFPTQNPLQPVHADVDLWGGTNQHTDAFVSKVNATGTALVYSTFLGGPGDDCGRGIAVDSARNAYVIGYTSGMPTTATAFQTVSGIDQFNSVPFVTKLNADGSALVYSTYLGGTTGYYDQANGIAVDAVGNAYITGATQAIDFPTTAGAFQREIAKGDILLLSISTMSPFASSLLPPARDSLC